MTDLYDLATQDTTLRRAASTNGGEWYGPCPGCGGRDRFRVWPEKSRYWCRQCSKKGDSIQYLRDFRDLSFTEAKRALGMDPLPPSQQARARAAAHRAALAAAREEYNRWQRAQLTALTDECRDLDAECEIAEIAYRAIRRKPDLYSESDRLHWTHRLADFYNRLSILEYQLDLLTSNKFEAARFAWWREEEERGRLSA